MLEAVFSIAISGFLGLIFMDIRELRTQVNKIENELILLSLSVPKRKNDIGKI